MPPTPTIIFVLVLYILLTPLYTLKYINGKNYVRIINIKNNIDELL